MMFKKSIAVKAKTESEANQIASAMENMSGHFSAKEWAAISKKLNNKLVQMRIRLLIQ